MSWWIRSMTTALFAALTVAAQAADSAGTQLTVWERFKAYAHHEKDVAVKEGHKLIAATDRQLDEMKGHAKASAKETKAAWKADMDALEGKKKVAKAHLDKMARSSSGAWDATKDGFANAYKDLHQAYDKARAAVTK